MLIPTEQSGIRDKGRVVLRLKDFLNHPTAKEAGLNVAEVAVLRPNPLPVTVLLIIRALNRLRAVGADKDGVSEVVL